MKNRVSSLFKLAANELALQHLPRFESELKKLTYPVHRIKVAQSMLLLLATAQNVLRPRRKFYTEATSYGDMRANHELQWVTGFLPSRYLVFRSVPNNSGCSSKKEATGKAETLMITRICRRRILTDIKKLHIIIQRADISLNRARPTCRSYSSNVANRRNFFDILPPFS